MRRNGYIVLLIAAVAWVTVAIVLSTGSLSSAHTSVPPSGPSPACLPSTLTHSAALAGTGVDVSPAPETGTANPYTQISFLGDPVTDIQDVSVEGSRTGYHYGHVYGYYQGDGGSFVPDKPFDDRRARARARARSARPARERRTSFSFRIATPYPTGRDTRLPQRPRRRGQPAELRLGARVAAADARRHLSRPQSRARAT